MSFITCSVILSYLGYQVYDVFICRLETYVVHPRILNPTLGNEQEMQCFKRDQRMPSQSTHARYFSQKVYF